MRQIREAGRLQQNVNPTLSSFSLFLSFLFSLFLSLSLSLQVDAGDGEGADTSGPTTVAFEARQLKTLFLRLYDR